MSLDLRPLTLGELLDRSFALYRRHLWLFVGIMAVPSVLTLIISVATQLLQAGDATALAGSQPDPETVMAFMAAGVIGFLVMFLAYWVAYMLSLGATTVAVADLYAGRTPTIGSSYLRVRGHIGWLTVLLLSIGAKLIALFVGLFIAVMIASVGLGMLFAPLGALLMVLGMIGAMLACALYALRYAVAVPVLVLENARPLHSIARSVALTRGSMGRTAVITVFAMVITYAAMAIFQGPFIVGAMLAGPEGSAAFWLALIGTFTGTVGSAITGPLMIVALALLYYDIRIRKEGLDVEMMVAALETPPTAPATVRPVNAAG